MCFYLFLWYNEAKKKREMSSSSREMSSSSRSSAQQPTVLVNNRWLAKKRIGQGAFGDIFIGLDTQTQKHIALKFEHSKSRAPQLEYESRLYQRIPRDGGFAKVYWYGQHGPYNVMVLQLLGHSLQDMFKYTGGKTFSVRITLLLAEQALLRLQTLHACGILHRDIKPANFVMGRGRMQECLYLIDFGLSKFYLDPDGNHIAYRTEKELTGTARYASLNTHLGREQSRRDDLESLGFVLVYFIKGFLPWQGARPHETKEDLYLRISNHKESLPIPQLCVGLPPCFCEFLLYCRNLGFTATPNYDYLRGLFTKSFDELGFDRSQGLNWANQSDAPTLKPKPPEPAPAPTPAPPLLDPAPPGRRPHTCACVCAGECTCVRERNA